MKKDGIDCGCRPNRSPLEDAIPRDYQKKGNAYETEKNIIFAAGYDFDFFQRSICYPGVCS